MLANVTLTNGGVITFSSDSNTYSYEFILWVVVLNVRNEFQCRKLLVNGAAYLTDVAFSIVSNVLVLRCSLCPDMTQGTDSLSPIEALQGIFGSGITVVMVEPDEALECARFTLEKDIIMVRRQQHSDIVCVLASVLRAAR